MVQQFSEKRDNDTSDIRSTISLRYFRSSKTLSTVYEKEISYNET